MASSALQWASNEDEAQRWPADKASVPKPQDAGFQPAPTRRSKQGVHHRSSPVWAWDEDLRICTINVCSTANGATVKTIVPVRVGGLTQEQIISLAYNIRSCEAQVVCVQQLNLFSKEWENVCDLLGNEWSSIASHDGEIRMSSGALSGLAVFSRFPIKRCELFELFDGSIGMEDVNRRAAMAFEVVLSQDVTIRMVNVCFEEMFERFRMSQLEQLKRQMKKTLPDFEREGYVLVGAINGLKREDYSDGSWDFIEFERRRLKTIGGITEQPMGGFMKAVLAEFSDSREVSGYSMVFEDGAMIESTGRHNIRTDYVLLSPSLLWAPPHHAYDVLPPPQHTDNCHHLVITELRRVEKEVAHSRKPRAPSGRRVDYVQPGFGNLTQRPAVHATPSRAQPARPSTSALGSMTAYAPPLPSRR